jgi:hypothetical protein
MIHANATNPVVAPGDRLVTVASAGTPGSAPPELTADAQSPRRSVFEWLHAPVDATSLAVFRIVFGTLLVWEV